MINKYGYGKHKNATANRLSKIEGQVRGVATMVENDKYCIDILTQISAAQKALDSVALELLNSHVSHCMGEKSLKNRAEMTTELMNAVGRLVRSS